MKVPYCSFHISTIFKQTPTSKYTSCGFMWIYVCLCMTLQHLFFLLILWNENEYSEEAAEASEGGEEGKFNFFLRYTHLVESTSSLSSKLRNTRMCLINWWYMLLILCDEHKEKKTIDIQIKQNVYHKIYGVSVCCLVSVCVCVCWCVRNIQRHSI